MVIESQGISWWFGSAEAHFKSVFYGSNKNPVRHVNEVNHTRIIGVAPLCDGCFRPIDASVEKNTNSADEVRKIPPSTTPLPPYRKLPSPTDRLRSQ